MYNGHFGYRHLHLNFTLSKFQGFVEKLVTQALKKVTNLVKIALKFHKLLKMSRIFLVGKTKKIVPKTSL
jgi:hypothetical protein